jgi:anionic cell wall polymer biosynthesis LytR-Cps2A-Psr (LCP) family protein
MKKIIKYIPWILLGIALITIGFFAFSLNSMKLDAIQQIKNIQAVEEKFQATQNANVARLETLKVVLDKAQAERDVYAEQRKTALPAPTETSLNRII